MLGGLPPRSFIIIFMHEKINTKKEKSHMELEKEMMIKMICDWLYAAEMRLVRVAFQFVKNLVK